MSIEQNLCKVKYLIDKRFAVKNSGRLRLALMFNMSNLRTTILKAKNQFKVCKVRKSLCDCSYTVFLLSLIYIFGSVVLKVTAAPWPFCMALSPSVH